MVSALLSIQLYHMANNFKTGYFPSYLPKHILHSLYSIQIYDLYSMDMLSSWV